jgi:hypothetical protein
MMIGESYAACPEQVQALILLQLAAAVGHAYILDVPAPGSSSSPVSTPFAQAALLLSLSTILSTLAFACVGACSAALLFWWKAHQILPASADGEAGVSEHEVAVITAWWFRCFYLGGGAVGLAHGIMLRWARRHVLSFPPHQRRMLPRLREALPRIAVGAASCVLRAMALVIVLFVCWAIVFHGSSITRGSWWADRFTTTVLALGLAPSPVSCALIPLYEYVALPHPNTYVLSTFVCRAGWLILNRLVTRTPREAKLVRVPLREATRTARLTPQLSGPPLPLEVVIR